MKTLHFTVCQRHAYGYSSPEVDVLSGVPDVVLVVMVSTVVVPDGVPGVVVSRRKIWLQCMVL